MTELRCSSGLSMTKGLVVPKGFELGDLKGEPKNKHKTITIKSSKGKN